ncbi:MAG: F0F1 ATP synthase subunit B [Chitinophagales bacterium]|nr:F0F1 ATP synthase subunit B [Bacteroidota bacterium]MBP7399497.1 F0F1 ATP synthase subunit B [Chitinophagales bacterium]MBK8681086.1 F0F1 ATP synthase subunit B [Bacteroidota bacterium]MBP8754497.1 F0F1 ATP synthase subunit B [Chitinophagales bacterium]MBP9190076.1 F0F1 ATP synthase subunit B [Chitinophagales bacterium]
MFLLIDALDLVKPDPGLFIWTVLVFLIVFFILWKFAFKPIGDALRDRENHITNSLLSAEKAREEMANLKVDNERILNEAREERSKMLRDAKESKEQIITEARDRANSEYNRIVSEAQRQIDNQKMAALIEIKNSVGKMVLEVSEKVLRRELSLEKDQEDFVRQMVDEIKIK